MFCNLYDAHIHMNSVAATSDLFFANVTNEMNGVSGDYSALARLYWDGDSLG